MGKSEYAQVMRHPCSFSPLCRPLLLTLLGRASEKEQIVYLEGVTSEAVRKLLLL